MDNNQYQVKLDQLSRELDLQERTLDFIQFRTAFVNNFDFERLADQARLQQIKRCGSRSTAWKMMLGVLPNVNNKQAWLKTTKEQRLRYQQLKDKYMKLNNQIHSLNPLASLNNPNMMREIFSMKEDRDIKILIKKDVDRTMQELPFFKDALIRQKMEEILYLWSKEYPEYKYQQGMNEILAIILICVVSEQVDNNSTNSVQNIFEETSGNTNQAQKGINLLKLSLLSTASDLSKIQQESGVKNNQAKDILNSKIQQESNNQLPQHSFSNNVEEEEYDEFDQSNDSNKRLFRELHDSQNIWADIYCMFENLMNLGVKELYYKDINTTFEQKQSNQQQQKLKDRLQETGVDKNSTGNVSKIQEQVEQDIRVYTQLSSMSSNSSNEDANNPSKQAQEREKQRRLRKQQLLELNQEDAKKTSLKRRANKIVNVYLRELDPELFSHIQDIDIQPELLCLKYLRCLMAREFKVQSALYLWDFIISGITDHGRIYLQELAENKSKQSLEKEPYFLEHLDYLCLAMIQLQRQYILKSDYIGCLKLTSKTLRLQCHSEVIGIADRIGKIIFERLIKQHSIIRKEDFPRILEKDVEKFMQEYSLRQNESEEEEDVNSDEVDSHEESSRAKRNRKFFKVKEEDEEEDNEEDIASELSDHVGDLSMSQDRIKDAEEVEAILVPKQGSIVIDEDGDTFVDCKTEDLLNNNNGVRQRKGTESVKDDNLDESFHSVNENIENDQSMADVENISVKSPSSDQDDGNNKRLFKLKDTKGKVIYDHATKQRRFMSPFEQFIAEQEGLFKKDELRHNDEQNSVTLTTTASTQFDSKTVVIGSLRSGAGSLIEEPISMLPKKPSQVMKPNNKLAKLANVLQYDAKVKQVEDYVMLERKQNLRQLKTIKGYLNSTKTAKNCQIMEKVQRAKRNLVDGGGEAKNSSFFNFISLFS